MLDRRLAQPPYNFPDYIELQSDYESPLDGHALPVSQNLASTVQRQQKNRETGFGPRLPVESESTIRSANVRSISLRSRPACGRGIPCHAARSPLASLRPRFAFAQKRSPWSADYVYSSRLPHSARGRPR